MRALRVALTTNFSPWSPYSGGGQRSTHKIACALSARGHDVTVIYTRAPGERFPVPDDLPYAIRWANFFARKSHRAAPLRPLNALTVATHARRLHRESALDALHGNGEEAVLAVRAMKRVGVRTIMTPRYPNYPAPLLAPDGPSVIDWARIGLLDSKYLLVGSAARHADICAPTSESAAAMLTSAFGVDEAKMHVVPNGIDEVFFDRTWRPSTEASAPIVFFGRLSPDKGIDVLLDAMASLNRKRQTPLRLRIIGRGPAETALRRQAETLGLNDAVEWVPWMSADQLANSLVDASLAALPSRHESFGNAMAEAMAVGTPLVSTRAGSIPEVVQDGETGLLVEAGAAAPLADAIHRLVDDPALASALSEAGRAHTRSRFSWTRVAAQFEALYRGGSITGS